MPTFTIHTRIEAPIERCFDLARSVDLHTRSSRVPERAVAGRTSGLLELGDEVTWEARHFWTRQRLTSRIVEFDPPRSFRVEMVKGAFASHTHEFTFTSIGGNATVMHEVFQFRSPLGILGRIADAAVLTRYLKRFMRTRNDFLREQAERPRAVGQADSSAVGAKPHRLNKPVLIFDGDCGFCTTCAGWARRRLGGGADIVPGQQVDVTAYGLTARDVTAAAWWIDPAGRSHRGHRAVGMALQACGGWWRLLSHAFLTPPFSWLAAAVYRLVARFRHRLPGGTPACRINRDG